MKNISEKEINDIREIQARIEEVRKETGETQASFSAMLGISLDEYKNRVNKSKLPKNLKEDKILNKISDYTGCSIKYLKTGDNTASSPIKEHDVSINDSHKLFEYIRNHEETCRALCFFLLRCPQRYRDAFEQQLLCNYEMISEYSFFNYPEIVNKESIKMLIDYKEYADINFFKENYYEALGDEAAASLPQPKSRKAVKNYLDALLVWKNDKYTFTDNIIFSFSSERIVEKILTILERKPSIKFSKELSEEQRNLLNHLLSR